VVPREALDLTCQRARGPPRRPRREFVPGFHPGDIDRTYCPGNYPDMTDESTYAAFLGPKLLAWGDLGAVLRAAKEQFDRDDGAALLVFDDRTGKPRDYDLRGNDAEAIVARALPAHASAPGGRGRPKLGVVSREVTLLPRHWEWLEEQPNGISAALRRLVDEARKREPGEARARRARDAAHAFMTAMAGDRPGFEEALRALYAKDRERFTQKISRWPGDIRRHAERLAEPWF
jgi:hypothetical protein